MRKLIEGLAALNCLWLCHCSEPEPKKESLDIQDAAPITIKVGDSTSVLSVSRTTFSQTGKSVTDNPYLNYSLKVADTAVAKVVDGHRLVGIIPGETTVKASDDKGTLVSGTVAVKVLAKP